MDPHAPSQYIEQWSTSVEKSLGQQTTLEIGYLGSHGVHLQRAHLINNAPPGTGSDWAAASVSQDQLRAGTRCCQTA